MLCFNDSFFNKFFKLNHIYFKNSKVVTYHVYTLYIYIFFKNNYKRAIILYEIKINVLLTRKCLALRS